MPAYSPSSTEGVLQLTDLCVLVFDTSTNKWTIKWYDSTSASWVDVLTIDGSTGDCSIPGNLSVSGQSKTKDVNIANSASPTVAASGGTPTEVTVVQPDSNHNQIIPIAGKITIGGTLATGEDITVTIIAHYNDGTTGTTSKTISSATTVNLDLGDIYNLIAGGSGKYITAIGAEAQSNKTTTSATCTVEIAAIQR